MLPKLALSITSFMPLYTLMIFMYSYAYRYGTGTENLDENVKNYIKISILTIIVIQFLCSILVNHYIKSKELSRNSENELVFNNIKEDKKASVNYMMTYLLPLLTFELDKVNGFYILYTNVLIILFIIMNARAENFNFNIFLWIKGYSVYIGSNNNQDEKVLLMKKKKYSNIRSNHSQYKFVSFGGSNDIYLCKRYGVNE